MQLSYAYTYRERISAGRIHVGQTSGHPQSEQPVAGPRGDDIAERVMRGSDQILISHLERIFELSRKGREAVQLLVGAGGVDPLPARRDGAVHEVGALRLEGLDQLPREGHQVDGRRLRADRDVLGVRRPQRQRAERGGAGRVGMRGPEGAHALCALRLPHARRPVRRGRDDPPPV